MDNFFIHGTCNTGVTFSLYPDKEFTLYNFWKIDQSKNKISLFTNVRQRNKLENFFGEISYQTDIFDVNTNKKESEAEIYTFYIKDVTFDDEIIHINCGGENLFEYVFIKKEDT